MNTERKELTVISYSLTTRYQGDFMITIIIAITLLLNHRL